MYRKSISLLVMSTLLISFIATAVTAQSKEEKAAIEQVKKRIVKLGTGPEAKAQVKLRDKTKLKGYVSKTEVESFVITDAKTNAETTVTDANVTELTTRMPRGAVVVISALAAVGECFSLAHASLRRAENCNAVTIITF